MGWRRVGVWNIESPKCEYPFSMPRFGTCRWDLCLACGCKCKAKNDAHRRCQRKVSATLNVGFKGPESLSWDGVWFAISDWPPLRLAKTGHGSRDIVKFTRTRTKPALEVRGFKKRRKREMNFNHCVDSSYKYENYCTAKHMKKWE